MPARRFRTVREYLAYACEELGFTRVEFAEAIGISRANIQHMMSGRVKMRPFYRLQIDWLLAEAKALDILAEGDDADCIRPGRTFRDEDYLEHLRFCPACLAEAARNHRIGPASLLTPSDYE